MTTIILLRHPAKWWTLDRFSVVGPLMPLFCGSHRLTTTILYRHPTNWWALDRFSVVGPLIVHYFVEVINHDYRHFYRHPAKWSACESFSVVGPFDCHDVVEIYHGYCHSVWTSCKMVSPWQLFCNGTFDCHYVVETVNHDYCQFSVWHVLILFAQQNTFCFFLLAFSSYTELSFYWVQSP